MGTLCALLGLGQCLLASEPAPPAPPPAPSAPQRDAFVQDVAWSPDGRFIAFSEYDGSLGGEYNPDGWSIYVVGSDGTGRRKVIADAMYVSWSPDGDRLVFGSDRDGNQAIYSIGADGGGLRRLTNDPEAKDKAPAWSPRGDLIAYSSDRQGNLDVCVMGADGSGPRRLSTDPARDYNPAWSPDGRFLVFYREKGDGKDQVLAVAADGSREWAVTADERNNTFPSVRSDGRIAFTSSGPDKVAEVAHVAADGTDRQRVEGLQSFFARWSPDGRSIAYIAGGWPRSAIWVMDAEGTGARRIVN